MTLNIPIFKKKKTLKSLLKLWGWGRLLRVLWTAGRSKQSILKKINPEYSLERLMLKLQYFDYLMQRVDWMEKTLMLGTRIGKRRIGGRGWKWLNGQLNGHEFEQPLGGSEGQGSLVCHNPWADKELYSLSDWIHTHTYILKKNKTWWTILQLSIRLPCSLGLGSTHQLSFLPDDGIPISLGDYLAIHGTATVTNARLVHVGLEAEASWRPLLPGPEKEEAEGVREKAGHLHCWIIIHIHVWEACQFH